MQLYINCDLWNRTYWWSIRRNYKQTYVMRIWSDAENLTFSRFSIRLNIVAVKSKVFFAIGQLAWHTELSNFQLEFTFLPSKIIGFLPDIFMSTARVCSISRSTVLPVCSSLPACLLRHICLFIRLTFSSAWGRMREGIRELPLCPPRGSLLINAKPLSTCPCFCRSLTRSAAGWISSPGDWLWQWISRWSSFLTQPSMLRKRTL